MSVNLVNIGFGNIVLESRIIAVLSPDSAPLKRLIQESREKGVLIDATFGRKTRALIITDSQQIILSAIQSETIANRMISRNSTKEVKDVAL
ncbi:MAG: DUF370 domain-containing protein [Alkaliphilus sp.]